MSEEVDKPEAQQDEDVRGGEPEPVEEAPAPAEGAAAAEAPQQPAAEEDAPADEQAAPESAEATEEEMDAKEVEEGKVLAIVSYIIGIVALIPLIQRNNAFSLYHAKQVLILMIAAAALAVVNVIPCIGQIICAIGMVFLLVLDIMGLINAINGKAKPIPILGKLALDWFKGMTKQ